MALFDELRSFLAEVESEQVKTASSKKKAEANTEAGSYEGGTTHPVKSVDDQTGDAHEGERSSENSADVKKQVPGGGVDSSKESPPGQEGQQYHVGLKSAPTGEDPSHEDDYKGTKDDPGTSHPAKTEDGEKYSSMSFSKLKGLTEKKANALIAGISVVLKEAEAADASKKKPVADKGDKPLVGKQHKLDVAEPKGKLTGEDFAKLRGGHEEAKVAAAVGYDQAVQAGAPAEEDLNTFFKAASENLIKGALNAATLTGNYITEFNQHLTKQSEESHEHEGKESEGHEASESPAEESAEDSSKNLGLDSADMAAMAGGEGAEGGEGPAVDELLAALAEMGVTPDQVLEALGGAGGMGGEVPPEALPPEMAPKMASAQKVDNQVSTLIKAAKSRAKSGKFRISEAKTAGQRQLRDEIKKCIAEIVA
jgi:hypothetical protein